MGRFRLSDSAAALQHILRVSPGDVVHDRAVGYLGVGVKADAYSAAGILSVVVRKKAIDDLKRRLAQVGVSDAQSSSNVGGCVPNEPAIQNDRHAFLSAFHSAAAETDGAVLDEVAQDDDWIAVVQIRHAAAAVVA